MHHIIKGLADCLQEDPVSLQPSHDYLQLRSAKFNCKAGFPITSDERYAKPSVVLDDSIAPDYHLSSSSVFTTFNFTDVMDYEKVPIEQRMCDHVTEISLHEATLRLLENKEG